MKSYKATGIVLHTIKYGDSSLVAYMLTDTLGRQTYMVQGVGSGRGHGNKGALLQPMFVLELEGLESPRAEMHRIREMRSAVTLRSIPFDVRKGTIALFMAEMLYRLVREVEPNSPLFDFVRECVTALDRMGTDAAGVSAGFGSAADTGAPGAPSVSGVSGVPGAWAGHGAGTAACIDPDTVGTDADTSAGIGSDATGAVPSTARGVAAVSVGKGGGPMSGAGVANFHLWFMVALSRHLGFFPGNEWAAGHVFDIRDGLFTPIMPRHGMAFSRENSALLGLLMDTPADGIAAIALGRGQRVDFLNAMLAYFGYHLDATRDIRSVDILREVF